MSENIPLESMRRVAFLLMLAGLSGATGCGGGSASTTGPEPTSAVSAQHRACAGSGGSLSGDVDGDGKADRVTVVSRAAPSRGCVYALLVHTGSRTRRYGLGTRNPRPGHTASTAKVGAPSLDVLARIDRRAGLEIVADTWRGASTAFAAVFTIKSGRLVMMSGQSQPPLAPAGRAFPYSGSVTHQDGVDCARGAGSGLIVASAAAGFGGEHWNVARRFYRVVETGFLGPFRTQRVQIPYRNSLSTRFPEFSRRPFSSCTEATP